MPKCSLQIHIAVDGHFDMPGLNSHRLGNQLTSKLGASGQGSQQEIARACRGTCATNSFVGLRLIDGAADIDRTGQRRGRLATFRGF